MAGRVITTRLLRCSNQLQQAVRMTHMSVEEVNKQKIGSREWVCYGLNGQPNYFDRADFPMPAIRFKEPTAEIQALKEKEKGDWKKLSVEDKKALYRASFCQTFAEMQAPTGEWKSITGCVLGAASLGIWMFLYFKKFIYPPLPITFDDEHQLAQLDRMLKLDINPITGKYRDRLQ